MGENMLLVAIGCGRLPRIFDISAKNRFVVFGTMEGEVIAALTTSSADTSALPVYFYEAG